MERRVLEGKGRSTVAFVRVVGGVFFESVGDDGQLHSFKRGKSGTRVFKYGQMSIHTATVTYRKNSRRRDMSRLKHR